MDLRIVAYVALAAATGALGWLFCFLFLVRTKQIALPKEGAARQYALELVAGLIAGASLVGVFEASVLSAPFLAFVVRLVVHELSKRVNLEDAQTAELKKDLVEAKRNQVNSPERAAPVWEVSRTQLELYITRNLAQVRNIFWITMLVMAGGFGLVVWGIVRALNDTQFPVALLTSISGIVTQFIGVTFLLIYRATMAQASSYVGTLERFNTVGIAIQMVDLIPDEAVETKNAARVELMKQILLQK